MQVLLRLAIIAACVLTAMVSVLVLVFIVTNQDQTWIWPRITASLFILAVNGAILSRVFGPATRADVLVLLGSVALVALGAAAAVHSYFMAEITGDLEAWAIMACLILVAQGTGTLLYLHGYRDATLA